MKKSKLAKVLALLLTGALCVTAGALAACNNEGENSGGSDHTHVWATTWSSDKDNHWHKCTQLGCTEVNDKAAHTEPDATTGKCTVCGYQLTTPGQGGGGGQETPEAKEVVVYFYNYNDWTLGLEATSEGEDVLDGATFTAVDGHDKWYTVTVPVDAEKENFKLIIKNTAADAKDTDKVEVDVTENGTLYISENGHDYSDFAAAEADPPIPQMTMAVHFQKPETWTVESGIAIYVYTGVGEGEYFGVWPSAANTHADSDHDGWVVGETEVPVSQSGSSLSFILFDVANNNEVTNEGRLNGSFNINEDVYITADGHSFNTFENAQKYLAGEAPEGSVYVTVHVQVIFGEGGIPQGNDVYLYAWSSNGNLNNQFGGWPGTKLEDEGDGWYSAKILISQAQFEAKDFHLIINNNNASQYDVTTYTGEATEYWVTGKGDTAQVTETKPGDESTGGDTGDTGDTDEPKEQTVAVYFHKPAEWTGSWVAIHAYYNNGTDIPVTGTWGETKMDAEADGWYKKDIKFPEGVTSFNVIIFDENDETTETRKSAVVSDFGTEVYISATGKPCANKDEALASEDTSNQIEFVIHFKKPDGWTAGAEIGIYAYGNLGEVFGSFAAAQAMTADSDGWYSVTVKVSKSDIDKTFHVIVHEKGDNNEDNRFDVEITVSEDGVWIGNDGVVTTNPNA